MPDLMDMPTVSPKPNVSLRGRGSKEGLPATPAENAAASKHRPKHRVGSNESLVPLALRGKLSKAARVAVREQKAKGLAITYKHGNQIIKESPDGTRTVIGTVTPLSYKRPAHVRVIGK